jgi:ferritin-like protein
MTMGSGYHETGLSEEACDLHRAIASLIEELEAVDWYHQRVDVSKDESLRRVLEHNRDEEIEHAVMTLEWLRRKLPNLDRQLRIYLFREGPIEEIKEPGSDSTPAGNPRGDLGIGKIE